MAFDFMQNIATINIDVTKLGKAYKDIETLSVALQRGMELGVEELVERTYEKVIEELNTYGLGDSKLASSVKVIPFESGLSITVGQEYAMFVEYGTGMIGASSPHKHGWQYGSQAGEEGWWYPTTGDDPNPTKYYSQNAQKYLAFTKGMPSRPFIYESWLWASRFATKIINKRINEECKKVGVK